MSKTGYYNQHGCHNCKWVFVKKDYDEEDTYYCNHHNSGNRPLCLSVSMGENVDNDDDFIVMDKWNEWAHKYSVNPWGFCKLWGIE